MKTHNDKNINACGTSLINEITVDFQTLVNKFGEPLIYDKGDKVDAEWLIEIDDEVFTIYNYKDGKNYNGKSGAKTKDITNWHIGGFKSSEKLIDYLKS